MVRSVERARRDRPPTGGGSCSVPVPHGEQDAVGCRRGGSRLAMAGALQEEVPARDEPGGPGAHIRWAERKYTPGGRREGPQRPRRPRTDLRTNRRGRKEGAFTCLRLGKGGIRPRRHPRHGLPFRPGAAIFFGVGEDDPDERGNTDLVRVYVDGVRVKSITPELPIETRPASPWFLGSGAGACFNGAVDDVVLYPVALTDDDILLVYRFAYKGLRWAWGE